MKVVALILCGLAVAAASEHWENFKTSYGKSYNSAKEEVYRRSVYEDNLKYINEHNERYQKGEVTFYLGMNQFGDMTQEEISATMSTSHMKVDLPEVIPEHTFSAPRLGAVDWRNKGAVTPVKDQGQCGSCWSFSATGALECANFLKTGTLTSLSEQNLVDCSWAYGNMGCNGGWPASAFQYVRDNGGIDTEWSYPYLARDSSCAYNPSSIGGTCSAYYNVAAGSEAALEDAVQNIGTVAIAIDASQRSFSFYSGGVYYEPACSSSNLDHAVLAAGFGSEGGQQYWLVKNSWASSWGDGGYIKMAKNMGNNCGVASAAAYPYA